MPSTTPAPQLPNRLSGTGPAYDVEPRDLEFVSADHDMDIVTYLGTVSGNPVDDADAGVELSVAFCEPRTLDVYLDGEPVTLTDEARGLLLRACDRAAREWEQYQDECAALEEGEMRSMFRRAL